jgi:hypothetical protein
MKTTIQGILILIVLLSQSVVSGQVYEVALSYTIGKNVSEVSRLFAVVPDPTDRDAVVIYGLGSRTFSYQVYAPGGPKREKHTEYYIDGQCRHFVSNGQLVLPQSIHGSIAREGEVSEEQICPVTFFFFGTSGLYGTSTRIQKADIFAMPLQHTGKFALDASSNTTVKTTVRQLKWGESFIEQTKQMGHVLYKTGQFETIALNLSAHIRATKKTLDSIDMEKSNRFSGLGDSLAKIKTALDGPLGAHYDAEEIFTERNEGEMLKYGSTITDDVAVGSVLDVSHRGKYHKAVVDAKLLTDLAGDAVTYNSTLPRIKSLAATIESGLASTNKLLSKVKDLQSRLQQLRVSRDSFYLNVVEKMRLYPAGKRVSVPSECSIRSPLLMQHESLQSRRGPFQDIRVTSLYSLKGLPLQTGCSPAGIDEYDTLMTVATLTTRLESMNAAVKEVWDALTSLSDKAVNPLTYDSFGKILRSSAQFSPSNPIDVSSVNVLNRDIVSFNVFGKTDQQLDPYIKQIHGVIGKIADGRRIGKYTVAEEYVKQMRATAPLNAEALFGDKDDVAERALGSLFMLYFGALEAQKESVEEILSDANADELMSDLFDVSEGAIDDVFDDVVKSKKIVHISVNSQPVTQYQLKTGVKDAAIDEFISICEAQSKILATKREQAVAYLSTLKYGIQRVEEYATQLCGIVNSLQTESSLPTFTNIPQIASTDLCSVLNDYSQSLGTSSKWTRQSNDLPMSVSRYLDEHETELTSPMNEAVPEFIGFNPTTQCWQFSWYLNPTSFMECDSITNFLVSGYAANPRGCARKALYIDTEFDTVQAEEEGE